MFLHQFEEELCAVCNSMEVQLPRKGLKLDTRANYPHFVRFSVRYHDDGITVTLTRLDDDNWDDEDPFSMRAFDPETKKCRTSPLPFTYTWDSMMNMLHPIRI